MLTPAALAESLKMLARSSARAVSPGLAEAILSARARAHSQRLARQWGLIELNRRLVRRFGSVVQASPFAGLVLSPMTHEEHLGPFLLGTYEEELHPWFEVLLRAGYAQVVDIGAKFGYYAVGIARLMPSTPVVAFDTDAWARRATREMAAVNGTPNVTVAGFCSMRWLDRRLRPNSLIVCDCEGYEGRLLADATTPSLDSSTLLVETHDILVPGVSARLRARFERSHAIVAVRNRDRTRAPVDLGFLSDEDAAASIREIRGPQEWLLMTPRVTASCA